MNAPLMLQRPMYGGVFGDGLYAIATIPTIENGLHAVRFMVVEPRVGTVLSEGNDKLEAIASARRLLHLVAPRDPAANDPVWRQGSLWPELASGQTTLLRSVSRRRRQIFELSAGRCHYCHRPLTLDGRWHVEHQVPRALGGESDGCNLVAACAPCNLAKSDRTALEFFAAQSRVVTLNHAQGVDDE